MKISSQPHGSNHRNHQNVGLKGTLTGHLVQSPAGDWTFSHDVHLMGKSRIMGDKQDNNRFWMATEHKLCKSPKL